MECMYVCMYVCMKHLECLYCLLPRTESFVSSDIVDTALSVSAAQNHTLRYISPRLVNTQWNDT
jgi:hypothetical protein